MPRLKTGDCAVAFGAICATVVATPPLVPNRVQRRLAVSQVGAERRCGYGQVAAMRALTAVVSGSSSAS